MGERTPYSEALRKDLKNFSGKMQAELDFIISPKLI